MTDNETETLAEQYSFADGPGKYDANIHPRAAAYIHDFTLNGSTDEEVGTIEYGSGWYGLILHLDDETTRRDLLALGWQPNDPTSEVGPAAAIVHEDDRGSVLVVFYETEEQARAAFAEAEAEYDEIEEEDE